MRHFVIGTAGHIDHGKTALIRALTGQDADRLPEEKRRGITTDLGFASFDLGDGNHAGVIDVPGHEKFIHNMAAGAGGMDLVLLVIAADEGIMPQTREHLDILTLLGVRDYIVVLNKCDLADEEWLEMAEEEVRSELSERGLGEVPFVRVSAKTGSGIDKLKREIQTYAVRAQHSESRRERRETPARLPVDRVFTVQGFGTVATGTMLNGRIEKGQELAIFPAGKQCRVRGIQVCGQEEDVCECGQRAALNLAGADREDIKRGDVLAAPGSLIGGRIINVRLNILDGSKRLVKNQIILHFYCGAFHTLCRAVLLDADCLGPGESGLVQLRLENDTALRRGDRFIVRFYSPLETIGGGVVLEAAAYKEKRFRKETLKRLKRKETAGAEELMELAVKESGQHMAELPRLCAELGLLETTAREMLKRLADKGTIYIFDANGTQYFLHRDAELSLQENVLKKIYGYLDKYPYRPGMPEAQMISEACKELNKTAANIYADWLVKNHILDCLNPEAEGAGAVLSWKQSGRLYLPAGYEPQIDEACRMAEKAFSKAAETGGYHFPSLREMDFTGIREDDVQEIMRLLELKGRAQHLSGDVYTLPSLAKSGAGKIRELVEREGKITISQVCGLFDTSRKNARLLLEYTDRAGITKKAGAESERVKA